MSNVPESSAWEAGVYQFETTDLIQGGPGGVDNLPHQQLGNRTKWLYDNKLTKTGDDTMTGRLTLTPSAGDALNIATQNGVNSVIRLTQASQTTASIKAIAGGILTIGVDAASGNIERMRIDYNGNVAIGSADTSVARLLIVSSTNNQALALNSLGGAYQGFMTNGTFKGYVGVAASLVSGGSANDLALRSENDMIMASGSSNERMRITADGNVGIGTTSIGNRLCIGSGSDATNSQVAIDFYGSNSNKQASIASFNEGGYNANLVFFVKKSASPSTTAVEAARIDSSGNLLVSTTSSNGVGTARLQVGGANIASQVLVKSSTSSVGFYASTSIDSFLQFGSGNNLIFYSSPTDLSSGTERMRIDSSGLVTHDTPAVGVSGRESVTASWIRQQNFITSSGAPVQSVAGRGGAVTLSTNDVPEASNLYFTNARASAAAPVQSVAGRGGAVTLSTTDVSEGSNLYFTSGRASAAAPVQSVNGRTGSVTGLAELSSFLFSRSGNGYMKIPDSSGGFLLLQWGSATPPSATQQNWSISFPIPFPNACLGFVNNDMYYGSGLHETANRLYGSPGTSGATMRLDWVGDNSGSFQNPTTQYVAIGY